MVFHSDYDGDYTPSECKEIVKTFDVLEPYFEQEKTEVIVADNVDSEEENKIETEKDFSLSSHLIHTEKTTAITTKKTETKPG